MTLICQNSLRLKIFFCCLLALVMSGCADERFYVDQPGEGEATISAKVVFSPVLNALDKPSRTPGDAIKQINSLCLFVYDENDNLIRRIPQSELENLEITDNGNDQLPSDKPETGDNKGHQAEAKTPKATFTLRNIPFGKYYFYAVANMGDLTEYSDEDLDTPEKLKDIKLTWNADNVPSNNQMFGYFTTTDHQTSDGFDAPLITVNKVVMQLHAWVKRAASKVTVAIDGSGLNDGVEVLIKSIQIRDIPLYCWLGKDHVASAHYLISEGEKTTFAALGPEGGELVNKQQSYPKKIEDAHTETANAYYFYENMQGEGQSKHQIWENGQTKPQFPNGNSPNDDGYKDHRIAGTYIEVIGYYNSHNETEGEGPIIYRFMLGKDVDNDYNAERNYHYKLTLKLKKWANDADWHIVYDQKPEIIARDPYYISYVYDETMGYPIKIQGGELISLKAEIPNNEINKNSWRPMDVKGVENPYPYWNAGTPNNPGPWNGFLSLRKTTIPAFGDAKAYPSGADSTYTYNQKYFDQHKRGWRTYDVQPGLHKDEIDGDYTITNNGNGEWIATIPFYTRARVMVAQTGYTGNNPYVAYQRKASVKLTAEIKRKDGSIATVTKDIVIQQMRRVVNPKGIWRSENCDDPFHVKMMILPYESATEFEPLVSDGPWLAVIQKGAEWFDLIPTDGISQKNPDGTISGMGDPFDKTNLGSIIDFTFKPKGTTSTPRGGIIKIYYNNFSCIHRIFVRQGYDPVSFYGSSTKWHSTNLITADTEASDPVLEGSYFRRHNTEYPIASSNNVAEWSPESGTLKDGSSRSFAIEGLGKSLSWQDIKTTAKRWGNEGKFTVNNKTCRIASAQDFQNIIHKDRPTIYGYGVIYTDGTTETPTKLSDVYGYNATPGNTAGYGMRGVFLCDSVTGTNIFLPIGKSGHGRFKQKSPMFRYNRLPAGWEGTIQYANRHRPMPKSWGGDGVVGHGVEYKPLFWDIWRREGALYWLHEYNKDKNGKDVFITKFGEVPSLDINYYTFDFSLSDLANTGLQWNGSDDTAPDPSGTDAVQIRLVED